MELYNEELTDLLSIDNDKDKRLRLLEDRSGVVVQGLEEVVVKSAAGEGCSCCLYSTSTAFIHRVANFSWKME